MIPVEISKNVYDVGVMDWNIRDFHGYSTHAEKPVTNGYCLRSQY